MDAVIAAGGAGTRLSSLYKNTPKALVKIGTKPIIEHQIIFLRNQGIKKIHLLLGHLGDKIESYLGDGKKWGVTLCYHYEQVPLGRTGALKAIERELPKDFLFLSGDIMMNFDLRKFIAWHEQKKDALSSLVVQPTNHMFDSDLVEADGDYRVTNLRLRPHAQNAHFQNLASASISILSPKIFQYIPTEIKTDFEKDILPLALHDKQPIYAYRTSEYFRDMGTPPRLMQVKRDYTSGKVRKLNSQYKRKAVFLDRDGVINEEVGQLCSIKDFSLYGFAGKAIKKLNDAGYLVIVATNQPTIAKGFMKEQDLTLIHKRMETELGSFGAKIDRIYYCPHHPEKGFAGEVPELKIKCLCRKPGIGLITKASEDFNIDVRKSFFIGDTTVDAKTAEAAGIKFLGVKTGYGLRDNKFPSSKNLKIYKNVLHAVNNILA